MLVMIHFLVFVIFKMSRGNEYHLHFTTKLCKLFSMSKITQLLDSRIEIRTWVSLVLVHSTHSHTQLYL